MSAYTPADWSDLFVAGAGAAAALTGLVFVAVSINIERILGFTGLPERALETVLLLLSATVTCIFGLVPGQSDTALGLELLGCGLACAAVVVAFVRSSLRNRAPGESIPYLGSRLTLVLPVVIPLVVGGASIIAGHGGGLYWILAGVIGALVSGVVNAWVLLVEILR